LRLSRKNFAQTDGGLMTEDEIAEVLKALEKAKAQTTYAYEFVPNSYTYHAYVSCLNAHRIVAAAVDRLERMAAA
jgi:hypothetical protein